MFKTLCNPIMLLLSALTLSVHPAYSDKSSIYVIREAGGVIRFTNKPPKAGERGEIFTASGRNFSTFSSHGSGRKGVRNSAIFPERFNDFIQTAARQHRIEPGLIKAVIHVESAFNPRARSPKGAQGLMQLMPGTAKELGVRDALSPALNIHGGSKHLARLLKRYEGNERFALAAYNAGEEAVSRHNGIPPFSETQDYVKRVLQLKKRYTSFSHG